MNIILGLESFNVDSPPPLRKFVRGLDLSGFSYSLLLGSLVPYILLKVSDNQGLNYRIIIMLVLYHTLKQMSLK